MKTAREHWKTWKTQFGPRRCVGENWSLYHWPHAPLAVVAEEEWPLLEAVEDVPGMRNALADPPWPLVVNKTVWGLWDDTRVAGASEWNAEEAAIVPLVSERALVVLDVRLEARLLRHALEMIHPMVSHVDLWKIWACDDPPEKRVPILVLAGCKWRVLVAGLRGDGPELPSADDL